MRQIEAKEFYRGKYKMKQLEDMHGRIRSVEATNTNEELNATGILGL